MINVREYLRSRQKRKSGEVRINYKEKIRSHKLSVFYRVILGIALMAAVVVMLYVSWQNRSYTESVITNSVPVTKVEGSTYLALGDCVLTYSNDGANCMDSKGGVLWNQTYEMQNPMVDINGSVAAIGDYNGRTIYVVSTEGIKGTITTNMPIRKFRVSQNGVVVAILDDSKKTWIHLLDSEGNILAYFKTTMDKWGYPLDVSISPNGELVGVSYFYVDSGKMKSSVAFYNFGAVGQNQSSDRFVSGYDYQNAVVPYIRFMNSNTIFAVSDDRIMFFGGEQKPLSVAENLLNENVQSIYYNENYVGLVFLNTSGEGKYRLDIYDTSGKLVSNKIFDMEYKDIMFYKDEIIIYSETEFSISNIRGAEMFGGRMEETAYLFMQSGSRNRFLLMTQDALNILEIK